MRQRRKTTSLTDRPNWEEAMGKDTMLRQDRQKMLDGIGGSVLGDLGRPPDLQRIQVRHLWDSCYRVNVLTGLDITSPRIAHSYFLTVDEVGAILSSTPPLVRRYGDDRERLALADGSH
jgi:hypothetical protein